MNPRTILAQAAALLGFAMVFSGCVQAPPRPAWRYLERAPARVAVIPASNHTDKVGAPLVVDKAWEEALRKAGFEVVSADSVVTYASSRNLHVTDLRTLPTAQLGGDLKVDYLLEDEIVDWGTKYQVIQGVSVVSCKSRLIEASTGASVWELDWISKDDNNNNNGGGAAGMLVNALVKSIVNSMFDMPTRLAQRGVVIASMFQPYPGHAAGAPDAH